LLIDKDHCYYFRYGILQVAEMKKGLKVARHSGLVHVKFGVSKDVASHIQQSVVNSWKQMQDLGVVSLQLDNEQLVSVNSGQHAKLCSTHSIEHQHCTRLSYPLNTYAESVPMHDCCYSHRSTRGRKRSQLPRSQAAKRRHNDGLQCTSEELYGSRVSVPSVAQEGMISAIGEDSSHRFNQVVASSSINDYVPTLQLPYHMTSGITGTAFSTVSSTVSSENSFTANILQCKPGTANAVHSHDLPPPSTPFVPKRRKRRKPAGGSSDVVLAKSPLCTKVDRATVPVHVNGGIEAPSKLYWPNYSNPRFQLNGHYPLQFNSPVFNQYAVSNARLMPPSFAGPRSHVALANCVKPPIERHLVLDSHLPVSAVTTSQLENFGAVSMNRSVPASVGHLLQPLLGSTLSAQNQCRQLYQSLVPTPSEAKLPNHFSQGSLELRHHNPETETKDRGCTENSYGNVSSRLFSVSSPHTTERNLCSHINTDLTGTVNPAETLSSLTLLSEVNSLESSSPVLKLSETIGSSSVESIQCSVISAASAGSSGRSANVTVQLETVDSNLPVSSSAVNKKCKPDTMNGYHFMSDYTQVESWHTSHKLVSSSVSDTVSKADVSLLSADDVKNSYDLLPAADHSAITEAALNKEVTANVEHSVNRQSHCDPLQSASSLSRIASGQYNTLF